MRDHSDDELTFSDHARMEVQDSLKQQTADRRGLMNKRGSGYSRVSMPAMKISNTDSFRPTKKASRRKSMNDGIAVLDCILINEKTSKRPSLQPEQIETLESLRNSLEKIEEGKEDGTHPFEEEEEGEEVESSTRSMRKGRSMINRAYVSDTLEDLFPDSDSSSSSDDSLITPRLANSAPPQGMMQKQPLPSAPSTKSLFRYGKKPQTGVNVLFAFGAVPLPSPRQSRKKLNALMSPSHKRISTSIMSHQSGKSSLRLQKLASRRASSLLQKVQSHAPKEWYEIADKKTKIKLAELLSWDNLRRWDFDIFEIDKLTPGNTLLFVGWAILSSPYSQHVMEEVLLERTQRRPVPFEMMEGYRFIDQFHIDQKKMTNFLRSIEKDYYHENPYHNNIHAADVLQTLHSLLQQMGGVKKLQPSPMHLFSVLLSAVIHDVGHPGFNNFFQQSSQSDIALCYNDQSCLENMHLALAFRKLVGVKKKSSINIFGGMSREEIATCRKLMIGAVLGTDMSKHFQSVNDVKKKVAELKTSSCGTTTTTNGEQQPSNVDDETTIELLHYMMHAADISNGAKQKHIAVNWADRCLEEFFRQGDREKELGLPVSPLCDRNTVSRPESQKGFIEFIIKPTFEVLVGIMPSIGTKIIPVLDTNLAFWNSQIPKTVVDGMEQLLDDFEKNDGVLQDDETASQPSIRRNDRMLSMESISSLDLTDEILAEEMSEELRLELSERGEPSEELKASGEFSIRPRSEEFSNSRGEDRSNNNNITLDEVHEDEEDDEAAAAAENNNRNNNNNLEASAEDSTAKLSFGSLISFSDDDEAVSEKNKNGETNSVWSSSKTLNADLQDDNNDDSDDEYEC